MEPHRHSISQSGLSRLSLRHYRKPRSQTYSRCRTPRRTYQTSHGSAGQKTQKINTVINTDIPMTAMLTEQLTLLGSTVISHEQLVPAGYFLSGQLGVMISPWALVVFPPQKGVSDIRVSKIL